MKLFIHENSPENSILYNKINIFLINAFTYIFSYQNYCNLILLIKMLTHKR